MPSFLPALDGSRVGRSATPAAVTDGDGKARAAPADAPAPRTAGRQLRHYSQQLGQQLTAAQRAQDFIAGLLAELDGLKGELSRQLSQRRLDDGTLGARLDTLAGAWARRPTACGGSLDGRLRLSLTADAQQRFTLHGMQLAALSGGEPETLVFSSGKPGVAAAHIMVGGQLSEHEVLQRFQRALAPAGIRVAANDAGELLFGVAEADWPQLASRLSARGGGVRLPAGQLQRLRAEAEADALGLAQWRVDDHAEVRQTLQQVLQAQARLKQAQQAVAAAIADARAAIAQLARSDEHAWAADFAADFRARCNQPADYRSLSEVLPALLGVSRYRVLSLLSLQR